MNGCVVLEKIRSVPMSTRPRCGPGQPDEPLNEAPLHLALAPNPASRRRARRFLAECITTGANSELSEIVVLLTSELVSNAVLHGGRHTPTSTVNLTVEILPTGVRVQVQDTGPDLPIIGNGDRDITTGRGLLLIDSLADHWGCERQPMGKTVWFEIAAPAPSVENGDNDGR